MKFLSILFLPVFLAACSSVSTTSTWKDPAAGFPLTNIAVRVIDHDAIVGSSLENLVCTNLARLGIHVSHLDPTANFDAEASDDNTPARLAQPGVQAVLVAREGDRPPVPVQPSSNSKIDPYANTDPTRARRILNSTHDLEHWQWACCRIDNLKPLWTTTIDIHIDEAEDRAEKLKPCAKVVVDQLKLSGLLK
jgi:hypothetical protein